jgi:hypothetical protein
VNTKMRAVAVGRIHRAWLSVLHTHDSAWARASHDERTGSRSRRGMSVLGTWPVRSSFWSWLQWSRRRLAVITSIGTENGPEFQTDNWLNDSPGCSTLEICPGLCTVAVYP